MIDLRTERLVLRDFDEERDAAFILRLLNEPSFIENIADKGVRTLDGARAYLRDGPLASYAKNGFGLWHVALAGDGTPVGMCGLIRRDHLPHVDVGYALLPEHARRGYALEAAGACVAFARRLGLPRLLAVVNPDNAPSIRLLEKLGFAHEGMVRMPGEADEIRLYGRDL